MTRARFLALLATLMDFTMAAPAGSGADIDRTTVDSRTPADIRWVRNAAGTNEQARLCGDPSIQVWGMGPATATPAEKR